jgi:hypothetical protein
MRLLDHRAELNEKGVAMYRILGIRPANVNDGTEDAMTATSRYLAIMRDDLGRRAVAVLDRADVMKDWPTCRAAIVRYLQANGRRREKDIREADIVEPSEESDMPWISDIPYPPIGQTLPSAVPTVGKTKAVTDANTGTGLGVDRARGGYYGRRKSNKQYLRELRDAGGPATFESSPEMQFHTNERRIAELELAIEKLKEQILEKAANAATKEEREKLLCQTALGRACLRDRH